MKTIPLEDAYNILQNNSVIILDDSDHPLFPSMAELDGSDENQFLYLGWQNDDGLSYDLKFAEGENREIKVFGSSMFLIDTEGEEIQIYILQPTNLE